MTIAPGSPDSTPGSKPASADWGAFTSTLAATLGALSKDQFLILCRKDRNWFVQFSIQGPDGIRAEMVSNQFLSPDEQISDDSLRVAEALGWRAPTEHGDGSPNYFTDWPAPPDVAAVAHLAVQTLTGVFGVETTASLTYEAFAIGGTPILLPTLGVDHAPLTDTPEQLEAANQARLAEIREEILTAMREWGDNPDLELDEDGDIALSFDSAMVFLRVSGTRPAVRVFSIVLEETSQGIDVLTAINRLNNENVFLRWELFDRSLMVSIDVQAEPLEIEHVKWATYVVGTAADELDSELQEVFGGKTYFGDYVGPKHDRYGGYL